MDGLSAVALLLVVIYVVYVLICGTLAIARLPDSSLTEAMLSAESETNDRWMNRNERRRRRQRLFRDD